MSGLGAIPITSLWGALLATGGLLLLGDLRRPVLMQTLLTVAAVLGWGALWGWALTLGPSLHAYANGALGPEAIVLTIAVASWFCVGAVLYILGRKRPPVPGLRKVLLAALALCWFCAVLLPFLGQGGSWPLASVVLAVCAAGLTGLFSLLIKV